MGYTTEFDGGIKITPPLDDLEMEYLHKFAGTRRVIRKNGPYFVGGSGFRGQGNDPDILEHNTPPPGQPGLWCQWIPNDDGTALVWDQGEKFYVAHYWMLYLIQHFLRPEALAIGFVPGIHGGHILEGTIKAQGADSADKWELIVIKNEVFVSERRARREKITPNDYWFPLTSPALRGYFHETFKVPPNALWTQVIVYVDPATGAMTNSLHAFIDNTRVAEFLIDESGRAKRTGMLEWEPGDE